MRRDNILVLHRCNQPRSQLDIISGFGNGLGDYTQALLALVGGSSRLHTKIEMLKQVARAWGLEPEKILTREAMASRTEAKPHPWIWTNRMVIHWRRR